MSRLLAWAVLAGATGCTWLHDPFREHLAAPAPHVRECAGWFMELDRLVDESGVRDTQQMRVPGFPYMRVDRMLASLAELAAQSAPALDAYGERLVAFDLEARAYELQNLPSERLGLPPQAALERTRDCARLLRELDLAKPERRAAILRAARAPVEDSSTCPAAFCPASPHQPVPRPARTGMVRFAPPSPPALTRGEVASLLAQAHLDPLKQPVLSSEELAALAPLYAPSFEIVIEGPADRFGALRWDDDTATPAVDASRHVVYVQPAYTRYGARVLLQLVYTVWFPAPGRLGGITWRVTLGPDGEPLVYDSIHPCGCDHQFFPTPRAQLRPAPHPPNEWAFVPKVLPRVFEGMRPRLTLASGTHRIEDVVPAQGPDSLSRYQLRPYDELRSMPRLARPWGRHFDEPDLIERRFVLQLMP